MPADLLSALVVDISIYQPRRSIPAADRSRRPDRSRRSTDPDGTAGEAPVKTPLVSGITEAVYERPADPAVSPCVTPLDQEPVTVEDPDLIEAMRLLDIVWEY